jgi:CheY-like chemotaxis protein
VGVLVQSLRILVVEDNLPNAILARDVLALRGHEVRLATSAAEARALPEDYQVDVVLLDGVLPDASGVDLLVHLRSRPGWTTVPFVAVTGVVGPHAAAGFMARGFAGYIAKPIDIRTFVPTIEAIATPR